MSADYFEQLFHLDGLNPVERYKLMRGREASSYSDLKGIDNEAKPVLSDLILLTLNIIDTVLCQEGLVSYNFYVQGDDSVQYLIEQVLEAPVEQESFLRGMLRLDDAKLIYRFTCARKFRIPDDRIKQLRINSWGKECLKETSLLDVAGLYSQRLQVTFTQYFNKYRTVYSDLLNYLQKREIDEITAKEIAILNEQVKIKLLS